jgi:hypothetical protein
MPITTAINWPYTLPVGVWEGHDVQHGKPFMRTTMDSGRARQRLRFTSVPSVRQIKWIFTDSQAALFESWFNGATNDGAAWFNMPSRSPLGLAPLVCRFVDMYSGPTIIGQRLWQVTASLEVWERPIEKMGEWWTVAPDFIIGSDIFDRAMNQKWPEAT